MNQTKQWVVSLLTGDMVVAPVASPVQAQTPVDAQSKTLSAPDYGSGASAGAMSNTNFNTPESDGRPGVEAYIEGMAGCHRGDFTHAVYMLKGAASWAYEPADDNLGVRYFQGEHVEEDQPPGAAWMFIAYQRFHQSDNPYSLSS